MGPSWESQGREDEGPGRIETYWVLTDMSTRPTCDERVVSVNDVRINSE